MCEKCDAFLRQTGLLKVHVNVKGEIYGLTLKEITLSDALVETSRFLDAVNAEFGGEGTVEDYPVRFSGSLANAVETIMVLNLLDLVNGRGGDFAEDDNLTDDVLARSLMKSDNSAWGREIAPKQTSLELPRLLDSIANEFTNEENSSLMDAIQQNTTILNSIDVCHSLADEYWEEYEAAKNALPSRDTSRDYEKERAEKERREMLLKDELSLGPEAEVHCDACKRPYTQWTHACYLWMNG